MTGRRACLQNGIKLAQEWESTMDGLEAKRGGSRQTWKEKETMGLSKEGTCECHAYWLRWEIEVRAEFLHSSNLGGVFIQTLWY